MVWVFMNKVCEVIHGCYDWLSIATPELLVLSNEQLHSSSEILIEEMKKKTLKYSFRIRLGSILADSLLGGCLLDESFCDPL